MLWALAGMQAMGTQDLQPVGGGARIHRLYVQVAMSVSRPFIVLDQPYDCCSASVT